MKNKVVTLCLVTLCNYLKTLKTCFIFVIYGILTIASPGIITKMEETRLQHAFTDAFPHQAGYKCLWILKSTIWSVKRLTTCPFYFAFMLERNGNTILLNL